MKVGSQLKQVLTNTWHIPACGACHQTAKEMDQRTPQEIRDEVDIWAERLHQNAKAKKWTSLMGAAVRFVDGATHAVAGNALYRRLILDVCDYVEHSSKACVFRGERQGGAPWNKSIERFRCS